MITAEMIERAREKHDFQFYENNKNGTTFEFGNPLYGTDCAIDTPIPKKYWTPSNLAEYIESQRTNLKMMPEVHACESTLRNICGEWKNFHDAYGMYDKEYLQNHPFHSRAELKAYVSSYQPEAISNISRDYDIHFYHFPDNAEEKEQMFDTMIEKLSDKLNIQKEYDSAYIQVAEIYGEKFDGPEKLTAESFDEHAPMHSFIDYSHWYDVGNFEEMQETLRKELADDVTHYKLEVAAFESTLVTSEAVEGIGGPYLATNSSRPLTLDPYLAYNPEIDSFYIQFSIFDTEVLDMEGNHFMPEQTDNLYDSEDLRDFGLSIPAENFISMSYKQFQTAFENGMTKFFEYCLKDETFQKRHPVIQQVVDTESKRAKVSDNIDLHDLLEPEKRKAAVQKMTKFFLKNGMDLNQIDDVLSDVKMTALFQAVELEKKDPSLGASKDSGR